MKLVSNARLFPVLAMILALPGIAPVLAAQPATPAVETYAIDPVHSGAKFEIAHLLVSTVSGQFNKFEGTIRLNPADLSKSSVDVVIDASSISTGTEARDKHLRSDTFFDVAKYPTITFTSTSVTDLGQGNLQVGGVLTMHGVSKPILIAVKGWATGAGMKPGSFQAGFRKGTLTLNRSDFGISAMMGPIGKEVDITLSVEANKVP